MFNIVRNMVKRDTVHVVSMSHAAILSRLIKCFSRGNFPKHVSKVTKDILKLHTAKPICNRRILASQRSKYLSNDHLADLMSKFQKKPAQNNLLL